MVQPNAPVEIYQLHILLLQINWIAGVFVGVDDPRRRMLVRACKATRVAELAEDQLAALARGQA